jgi:hypothetical protein
VHLATEGGLLYAEFVATVLPPVASRYRIGDTLSPDRYRAQAALHSLLGMPVDSAAAPWRFIDNTVRSAITAVRLRATPGGAPDHGARLSVRELGAEPGPSKQLQALDQAKCVTLLDRTVRQALIDFLTAHGVDATATLEDNVANLLPT